MKIKTNQVLFLFLTISFLMIGILDYKIKQGLEIPVYHSVEFGEQNPNGDDA